VSALEGLGPAVEEVASRIRELVCPLRWARQVGAPLGANDSLLLERAQDAVEVPDVDLPLDARDLGNSLEQLVAVHRAFPQEEEKRGLHEPLDARMHAPATAADGSPAA